MERRKINRPLDQLASAFTMVLAETNVADKEVTVRKVVEAVGSETENNGVIIRQVTGTKAK